MPSHECAVVWIRGEHDAATIGVLAGLLAEALSSTEGDIVVDLRDARFLGVGPLQLMLKVQRFLEDRGRALEFRAPSRAARVLLDLCGVAWTPAPATQDAATITGAAPALESWVAVPARARRAADPHIPAPAAAGPDRTAQPVRIGEL